MLRFCLLASVLAAGLAAAPGAAVDERGPFYLVGLPSLGTLTWRCDGHDPERYALGFRAFRTATTSIRLIARGRTVRSTRVHPRGVVRFPFVRSRVQRLEFVQGTGAGTLRATVTVSFVRDVPVSYCVPYAPPRIEVVVTPRTH